MDAVIPTEIGLPTIRTEAAKQDDANAELGRNLDWADEVRESAAIRMADYQQRASAHYNRRVRPRSLKMVRWVLRTTKYRKKMATKDYKKKSYQGAGLSRSFFSSPGGIEETSRLMPCFFIHSDSRRRTYHQLASDSPLQAPLSEANSPLALLFALINAAANLPFCFFSMDTSVWSCLTSPFRESPHPPPHASGHSIDSSRLLASAKSARKSLVVPPEQWIKLASASPVSSAADFHCFCAEAKAFM
ncbi:hypothetical protein CK203_035732 [Vitis vinifera]|uniref:Uncharacterized protein n=1 Tax=Vitis vinifera TaxID=29760 RepID=A0A438ICN8_VITVI|nr:hypothetical protein CK203_035732 [Vitis vinifera]